MTGQGSRSKFVTVMAWACIALGGLGALVTALQNIVFFTIFPLQEMKTAIQRGSDTEALERLLGLQLSILPFVLPCFFLVSLATFMAGFGLLKRRDWGRRLLIGILSLGIFWNVGTLIFQQVLIWTASQMYAELGPSWASSVATVLVSFFAAVFTLSLTVLLVWLVWVLISDRVKQQFHSGI